MYRYFNGFIRATGNHYLKLKNTPITLTLPEQIKIILEPAGAKSSILISAVFDCDNFVGSKEEAEALAKDAIKKLALDLGIISNINLKASDNLGSWWSDHEGGPAENVAYVDTLREVYDTRELEVRQLNPPDGNYDWSEVKERFIRALFLFDNHYEIEAVSWIYRAWEILKEDWKTVRSAEYQQTEHGLLTYIKANSVITPFEPDDFKYAIGRYHRHENPNPYSGAILTPTDCRDAMQKIILYFAANF